MMLVRLFIASLQVAALLLQQTLASTVYLNTTSSTALSSSLPFTSSAALVTTPPRANASCHLECVFVPIIYETSTWSQYITPIIVGTAVVVINNASNSTTTSTKYDTEIVVGGKTHGASAYLKNGTLATGPAPSTTQTWVQTRLDGGTIVVIYPTPYFEVESVISWAGTLPYTSDATTACASWGGRSRSRDPIPYAPTASPLPSHPVWPAPSGTVDPDDPYGHYYTLVHDTSDSDFLNVTQVEELWPGVPILASIYENCTLAPILAPASAVQSVTALLATSTAYVSNPPSTVASPVTAATSQPKPSVTETPSVPMAGVVSVAEAVSPASALLSNSIVTASTPLSSVTSVDTEAAQSESDTSNACTNVACFVLSAIGEGTTSATHTSGVSRVVLSGTQASTPAPQTRVSQEQASQSLPGLPQDGGNIRSSGEQNGASAAAAQQAAVTQTTPVLPDIPSSANRVVSSQSGLGTQQQAPTQAIAIGSTVATANGQDGYVINSQTLSPGGAAVTVAGTVVSLVPDGTAIVVNKKTTPIASAAQLQQTAAPVITVAGITLIATSASDYMVALQTLSPGGHAVTVSGTVVSLAPGATTIVVDGKTSQIATAQSQQTIASPITVAGATLTPNSASEYLVASQTLSPGGGAVTVADTIYSLASGGTAIVVNGHTTSIAAVQVQQSILPLITVAGATLTADSALDYIIASQTLSPGGSPVIVSGSTYSLAPGGTAIVVNGHTSAVGTMTTGSASLAGGTDLLPGSASTISGTTYSLPVSGAGIYINGISQSLPTPPSGSAVTLNGVVFTPSSVSGYILAGQTLMPGCSIVVSDTSYSLLATGSGIYIDGASTAFPPGFESARFSLGTVIVTPTAVPDLVVASPSAAASGSGNNTVSDSGAGLSATNTKGGSQQLSGPTATAAGTPQAISEAQTLRSNVLGWIMSLVAFIALIAWNVTL